MCRCGSGLWLCSSSSSSSSISLNSISWLLLIGKHTDTQISLFCHHCETSWLHGYKPLYLCKIVYNWTDAIQFFCSFSFSQRLSTTVFRCFILQKWVLHCRLVLLNQNRVYCLLFCFTIHVHCSHLCVNWSRGRALVQNQVSFNLQILS